MCVFGTNRAKAIVLIALLGAQASVDLSSAVFAQGNENEGDAANVQAIITVLDLGATRDFHQQLDKVRTFINDHSQHKIDTAFWDLVEHPDAFAERLIAHFHDASVEPVHMECSTPSKLMASILSGAGLETRLVSIYDTNSDLRSHTFLEVINPETKEWETQDPDYDIYWVTKGSNQRVSVVETATDIDAVEPCGRIACGWNIRSRERKKTEKLRSYFDIISIKGISRPGNYALYTARADITKVFSIGKKRGTFCQIETDRCNDGFYDLANFSSYAPGQAR